MAFGVAKNLPTGLLSPLVLATLRFHRLSNTTRSSLVAMKNEAAGPGIVGDINWTLVLLMKIIQLFKHMSILLTIVSVLVALTHGGER
jgi:hypothetical protein